MRAILTYHLPPTTAYLLRVEGNRRFNIQTIPRLTAQLSWKWKHVELGLSAAAGCGAHSSSLGAVLVIFVEAGAEAGAWALVAVAKYPS